MTTFKIVEMPKPEPLPRDEKMISMMKELLVEAEAGKIIGLCIVTIDSDYCAARVYGGQQNYSSIGALQTMAIAIADDLMMRGG